MPEFLSINDPLSPVRKLALFDLGFRPFFLLAGACSLIAMALWGGVYVYGWPRPRLPFSMVYWHAHEMIFGYGMAVVAGFLLTAVRNWTNIPTLKGMRLAGLVLLWLAARLLCWLFPDDVLFMVWPDLAFNVFLMVAVFSPVLKARQYQQIGMISKSVFLMLSNLCFYLGVEGVLTRGIEWGIHCGLYVLLALVFSMSRRVLPMFIERGVGYPVTLKNRAWMDLSLIFVFVLFVIADVFWRNIAAASVLAAILFVLHVVRLAGWHTRGIWKTPLLWGLYLGYGGAAAGFLIKALVPFWHPSPHIALHAFAVGGIGIMTMGMMIRVSLGHTGRDIREYSRLLPPIFIALLLAYVARVLLPLIDFSHYTLWLALAQAAWLLAFGLFVWVYAPILVLRSKPR